MKSYFGTYFARHLSAPLEATVLVFDKKLSIGYQPAGQGPVTESWSLQEVEAIAEIPMNRSRLRHKNGGECQVEGTDAARFIGALQDEQRRPWYKQGRGREWIRNVLLLLALLGGLFLLYLLLVPWISEKLAARVPVQTEASLGNSVYDAMGLEASEDTAQSRLLNEFFTALNIQTPYTIRLSVVDEPVVNAFALPGGRIVVYRSLLSKLESYPELAALLTHEFIHVHRKHATRSIFRRLGSKVFLGLLFGRFGSVTAVLVDHADNLKSLTYSRSLEKEADLEGLQLLLDRGIDPRGFTGLFNRLKESAPGSVLPEFMGSHPDLDKRIAYVEEAGSGASVRPHENLARIFKALKGETTDY